LTVCFVSADRTIYFHFLGKYDTLEQKYPLSTRFKLRFRERFAKGKTGRVISYRDSRLSALHADRWLANEGEYRTDIRCECEVGLQVVTDNPNPVVAAKFD
jgi:hypothetical protein